MSLSKRLIAAEYRGPFPMAGWKSAAEWAAERPAATADPIMADGPVAAAAGWYRVGLTFYCAGSGPFPGFEVGRAEPTVRPMQTHTKRGTYLGQLLLFD